jgi:putative membrane protein
MIFRHTTFFAFAMAMVVFASPVLAADTASSQSSYSQNFVQKATVGNQFEIMSSQLALDKTQNSQVKEFAQQMIQDHGKAGENMKAALTKAKKDINLQEPTKILDAEHQKILGSLKTTSGSNDFDAKYIKAQVNAHNETLALFRDYDKNGDNAALKNFAATTIPTLEMHKQHIDGLAMAEQQASK